MDEWFDFDAAAGDTGAQSPPLQVGRAPVATAAPPQSFQGGSSTPSTAPFPFSSGGFGHLSPLPQTWLQSAGVGFEFRSLHIASTPSTYPGPAALPPQLTHQIPIAVKLPTPRAQQSTEKNPVAATPPTCPSQPPGAAPSATTNRLVQNANNNHDQDERARDDPRIQSTAMPRLGLPQWDPAIAKLDDAAKWLSGRGCTCK
jgi:hypothetical protein